MLDSGTVLICVSGQDSVAFVDVLLEAALACEVVLKRLDRKKERWGWGALCSEDLTVLSAM